MQGATDLGLDVVTLPLYYGLVEGAWRHWCRVWEVDYDWLDGRFDKAPARQASINDGNAGHPVDALVRRDAAAEGSGRPDATTSRRCSSSGHGGNTVTRMPEAAKGIEKLDLLVVADPHPTTLAVLVASARTAPTCCRSAPSSRCAGSRTASNRSIQWGEQIVKPIFESKNDYEVMYLLAKKLGFADRMFKNIKVENNLPVAEDILREINRGGWSTGYCGQSPERLKAHMANQDNFDLVTLRGRRTVPNKGDYYGLPWPCWGTPEFKHPGTPSSTTPTCTSRKAAARSARASASSARKSCRTARRARSACSATAPTRKDSEIKDGYPEFTYGVLKKLGWDKDLTEAENWRRSSGSAATTPTACRWAIDLSGGIQRVAIEHGCIPYGNGKARAIAWNLPDPVPVHREPIYTPRPDLVAQVSDAARLRGSSACPTSASSVQKAAVDKGIAKRLPAHPHLRPPGRVRRRRRGDALQQVARRTAAGHVRRDQSGGRGRARHQGRRLGLGDRRREQLEGAHEGAGDRARRQGRRLDARSTSPAGSRASTSAATIRKGTDPIVLGESVNTLTTYGYDPVTGMQEPKATLCQIRAA